MQSIHACALGSRKRPSSSHANVICLASDDAITTEMPGTLDDKHNSNNIFHYQDGQRLKDLIQAASAPAIEVVLRIKRGLSNTRCAIDSMMR
jgi:hypothetical protein